MALKKDTPATPEPRERIRCAYEACPHDAVLRLFTATGWANMCEGCSNRYHTLKAKQETLAMGLRTREQLMAFCRNTEFGRGKMHGEFLKKFQGRPRVERVVGEDDECTQLG
jgi:hypothetical protein